MSKGTFLQGIEITQRVLVGTKQRAVDHKYAMLKVRFQQRQPASFQLPNRFKKLQAVIVNGTAQH